MKKEVAVIYYPNTRLQIPVTGNITNLTTLNTQISRLKSTFLQVSFWSYLTLQPDGTTRTVKFSEEL